MDALTLRQHGNPNQSDTTLGHGSAGGDPRWLLLDQYVNNRGSEPSIPDAKTTAASCTSTGQLFTVSFALAAPPAISTFCCEWIGDAPVGNDRRRRDFTGHDESKNLHIVAAHNGSALIEMSPPESRFCSRYDNKLRRRPDAAMAVAAPGLLLLQARHVPTRIDKPRSLDVGNNTALLRLVDGELLVCQLEVIHENDRPNDTAELCVLRWPGRDWEMMRLDIAHHEDGGELPWSPEMDAVVPVGVRFVCWVDYNLGFFFHDVADEAFSKLVYVPLPDVPPPEQQRRLSHERPYMPYRCGLGAAGLDAVRFVSVAPRCCCGGHGKTSCKRSRFAFNVTTWTLTLKKERPMIWVKDGVLDCDELWQLPYYGCLPRVAPEYPMVSSDNPDVVCFVLFENSYVIDNADKTVWMLEVDTRRKVLLSVVLHGSGGYYADCRLPAKLCW
nr:unnamed protein product [Digitaria exilis]